MRNNPSNVCNNFQAKKSQAECDQARACSPSLFIYDAQPGLSNGLQDLAPLENQYLIKAGHICHAAKLGNRNPSPPLMFIATQFESLCNAAALACA
jgi:hypothetical protein